MITAINILREFVKYQRVRQSQQFFIENQQSLLQLVIQELMRPFDCKLKDQVKELNDLCDKQEYKSVRCSYIKLLSALAEHSDGFLTFCVSLCI